MANASKWTTPERIKRGCYILGKLVEAWGCEPLNAVGACGCFMIESGCDPAAYNKAEKKGTFPGSSANGSGYGAGLALWSNAWKTKILKQFNRSSSIETWSMDDLIRIITSGCNTKFVNMLKNCKTAVDSTDIWLRGYENGGGGTGPLRSLKSMDAYTWDGGYKGAMEKRGACAIAVLNAYLGGEVGADIAGDVSTLPADYDGGYSSSSDTPSASGNYGVLSMSASNGNIYSSLTTSNDEEVKHTRIYQAFGPSLKLSTLEMNVDGSNSPVDSSTAASTTDAGTQSVEDIQERTTDSGNASLLAAGTSYPVIRINDYFIEAGSIEKFTIQSVDFVPTVELVFTTRDKEILKNNTIKDGDIMSVFMAPTQAALKSLRADFLITNFIAPNMNQHYMDALYTYRIYGELYVSNLYNANLTFAYSGTSRDALIYSAEQLKLGFFFNDPDNTNDTQMWYCTTEAGDEDNSGNNRPSNIKEFIQQTTSHAWKNFESFYDSWIDIRYGLTFLNINKQLGETGPDEKIDFTPWESAILLARPADAGRAYETPTEGKEAAAKGTTKPAVKMINNIIEDSSETNTFYCTHYEVTSRGGEISRLMGVNIQQQYTINNQGVDNSNNKFAMNYSMPYNEWKMANGFYMMIGPGKNESYNPGDSFEEFVKTNTKKMGGMTTDILADTDGEKIAETGDNMLATGAVNKFYDAATQHNRINNLQLLKKYVTFRLNGMNLGIMRGEKIPALIVNMSLINRALSESDENSISLSKFVEEELSGWFIIDGLTYVYNPSNAAVGSSTWYTEVKCIRREWPISGASLIPVNTDENKENKEVEVVTTIDPNNTNSVESKEPDDVSDETPDIPEIPDEPELLFGLTEGLEPYMEELWDTIRNVSMGEYVYDKVILRQGRWYAVDESGNAVDGYPYIKNGGQYKVMNEKGEVIYINTSQYVHFFGRAINITWTEGPELGMEWLAEHTEILDVMYKYGLSAYIEEWKSGTVTAQTIHIGTNTEKQKEWWDFVFLIWEDDYDYIGEYASYLLNNLYSVLPSKIQQDIDESTLDNKES